MRSSTLVWSVAAIAAAGCAVEPAAEEVLPTTAYASSIVVDRPSGSAVYVNHPLTVTLGVVSEGHPKDVHVTLGLMEKPAANATDEDLANLTSCIIAGTQVHLAGDGTETFTEFRGVVPKECLEEGTERTFNLQLVVDLIEEKMGDDDAPKIIVFNEREKDHPVIKRCVLYGTGDDHEVEGCTIDLVVKPSPGINVALTHAEPSSSVVVVYPPGEHPHVPDGEREGRPTAVSISAGVEVFGRDDRDPDIGPLPGAVTLTYKVRAEPDATNVGWQPMTVKYDSMPGEITEIDAAEQRQITGHVVFTGELLPLVGPGGPWHGLETFQVQVCANVPFDEHGDPNVSGADGRRDNCKIFPVRVVRATSPHSSASSYSADKDYAVSWGSKNAVQASFGIYSRNKIGIDGATSEQQADLKVESIFGNFDVFRAWGNGMATLTPSEGAIDAGISMFGSKLWGYSDAAGSVTFQRTLDYSKSTCGKYVFAALIIPVTVQFCVNGTTGIALAATVSATSVEPNVRPFAKVDAAAKASIGDVGFRVAIETYATILDINGKSSDGARPSLKLELVEADPFAMQIAMDVGAVASVRTLDILIRLVIEAQQPDICKKKILGRKFPYPCFNWKTVERYTIASFAGFGYSENLLSRKYTGTLE